LIGWHGIAIRPLRGWISANHYIYPSLPLHWQAIFRALGATDTVNQFLRKAEANWIAQHEPDVFGKMHKCLLLSGYLTHRLTGQFRDAVAAQVGYVPLIFDIRHGRVHGTGNGRPCVCVGSIYLIWCLRAACWDISRL
jgi:hypothetical protein